MPLLASLRRVSLALSLAARAYRTRSASAPLRILEQDDGTVVLVRHRYMPGLCFPGGGVAAGEAPSDAILRELREELGMKRAGPLELFGLYTRRVGWTTNLVALYRLRSAEIDFRPNLEISEIMCADPHVPPADVSAATRRRLAEFVGAAPVSPYW